MGERKSISRRGLLKRGAATALGVLAVPNVVSAAVLGAGGRAAPSERITLGFIGLGKMGREAHLNNFLGNGATQVVAVCDVEKTRLEQCKSFTNETYARASGQASYDGCAAYTDFRELLARPDIDAVVIATPDHWHAVAAIEAAKAGKDIYCEKPMAHETAEGRAMVDAVRRYGRVFQTGSQQRSEYQGYFRRAAELVRNGVIGDLTGIDINVGPPPNDDFELPAEAVPETLDWDTWVGPAPWRPYTDTLCPMNFPGFPLWRYYRDFGGGSYSDFGAHHFDIAQWALGMDDSGPVEIHPPDGKDFTRLTYIYANGVPMYHGGESDCVFHGTKGKINVSREYLRAEPASILEVRLGPNDVHLGRGMSHAEDWLHCIRTRQKPIADVEIGHRTATVCHLGLAAYRLNRSLKWDPVAERFVDDEEANRLLSRPMRAPWHV